MRKKKSDGGMGFRKLHEFNIARLGKQTCRFLSHPGLLVSKSFKAKYFLKCSFLEAKIGSNLSYYRGIILAAQGLVRKGAQKLIGNGADSFVKSDPWLPDELNPMVTTILDGEKKEDSIHDYKSFFLHKFLVISLFVSRFFDRF